MSIHTAYSTATFMLKIDIRVDKRLLVLKDINSSNIYLCLPDNSERRIYEKTLRRFLEDSVHHLGIHNVGRLRCSAKIKMLATSERETAGMFALASEEEDGIFFEIDSATMDDIKLYTQKSKVVSSDMQKELSRLFSVSPNIIDIKCVLYLATPLAAQRECHLVEVTTDNYEECVEIYHDAMVFNYTDASRKDRSGTDSTKMYNIAPGLKLLLLILKFALVMLVKYMVCAGNFGWKLQDTISDSP